MAVCLGGATKKKKRAKNIFESENIKSECMLNIKIQRGPHCPAFRKLPIFGSIHSKINVKHMVLFAYKVWTVSIGFESSVSPNRLCVGGLFSSRCCCWGCEELSGRGAEQKETEVPGSVPLRG